MKTEIAKTLKNYRMEKQLTLQQIANAVGLTVPAVWKIENGRTKPTELTVAKIRKGLPGIFASFSKN